MRHSGTCRDGSLLAPLATNHHSHDVTGRWGGLPFQPWVGHEIFMQMRVSDLTSGKRACSRLWARKPPGCVQGQILVEGGVTPGCAIATLISNPIDNWVATLGTMHVGTVPCLRTE